MHGEDVTSTGAVESSGPQRSSDSCSRLPDLAKGPLKVCFMLGHVGVGAAADLSVHL